MSAQPAPAARVPLAVILLYHRIDDELVDAFGNRVSPLNFASHLEILRDRFHPVRLRDLASPDLRVRLPERAVAVTFDDGYADNLRAARPLLERYGVPATVFVATATLDATREFWWDRLERLLLGSPLLERVLRVELEGAPFEIDLSGWERYVTSEWPDHAGWTAYGDPDPTPRHRALRELWRRLRLLPRPAREEAMERVASWAGEESGPRPRRLMAGPEVIELARGGLVEIGAHTVSHPSLAALEEEAQWEEIDGSRRTLEALLDREVVHFSFPFGQSTDYDDTTIKLLGHAGFTAACTSRPAAVHADTPALELPRIYVWNDDGSALASTLEHYFRMPATAA